jgi:predicted transcriptional regulator
MAKKIARLEKETEECAAKKEKLEDEKKKLEEVLSELEDEKKKLEDVEREISTPCPGSPGGIQENNFPMQNL